MTEAAATTDAGHLRGSTLLLAGRFIAIGLDLAAQVLVVRYLVKEDFGAFAYALAVVSIGSSFTALGLDKALSRFLPIYEERGEKGKVIGSLALALATMLLIGSVIVATYYVLSYLGVGLRDPGTTLLLIVIVLVPIQAIQALFAAVLAVLSSARTIFLRNFVLIPLAQLAVVAVIIVTDGGLSWLGAGWVLSGAFGVAVSLPLLYRSLSRRGYLDRSVRTGVRVPAVELYAFSVPLLSSDLVLVLRGALVPVLIAALATTVDVADFRAVFPHARLNLVVLQSFSLLFLPHAARFVARHDYAGLGHLHKTSTLWVTVMTFPIFALTFAFAPSLVDFLYGPRYADSATVMAILAGGFFVSGALGLAGLTLRAVGRVRYVFGTDVVTGLVSVAAYAYLIPQLGALGAAIATAGTLVLQALLYQLGARSASIVRTLDRDYLAVWISIALTTLVFVAIQVVARPPLWVSLSLIAAVTLVLFRFHRWRVDVLSTFPELARIPLLSRFLRVSAGP